MNKIFRTALTVDDFFLPLILTILILSPISGKTQSSSALHIEIVAPGTLGIDSIPGSGSSVFYIGVQVCNLDSVTLTHIELNLTQLLESPHDPVEQIFELKGNPSRTSRYIPFLQPDSCTTLYWMVGNSGKEANYAANEPFSANIDQAILSFTASVVFERTRESMQARSIKKVPIKFSNRSLISRAKVGSEIDFNEIPFPILQGFESLKANRQAGPVGSKVTSDFVYHDFGVLGEGAYADLKQRIMFQPIQSIVAFDPDDFELNHIFGVFLFRNAEDELSVIPFEDKINFSDEPHEIRKAVAYVAYEFTVLSSGTKSFLSPYQQFGYSTSDIRHSVNYVEEISELGGQSSSISIEEKVLNVTEESQSILLKMNINNLDSIPVGISAKGRGLVIEKSIPPETTWNSIIEDLQTDGAELPYSVWYSTNDGQSWSRDIDPNHQDIDRVQWRLKSSLLKNNSTSILYKLTLSDDAWTKDSLRLVAQAGLGMGHSFFKQETFVSNFSGEASYDRSSCTNCEQNDPISTESLSSLGSFIFEDINGNGEMESFEKGIAGIEVYLCLGSATCDASNAFMTTKTSDGSTHLPEGWFQFNHLKKGEYTLGLQQSHGSLANSSISLDPDTKGQVCGDANPLCDGKSLVKLDYPRHVRDLDFGFFKENIFGGQAWFDLNSNGLREEGELPFEGLTIALIPPRRVNLGNGPGRPVTLISDQNGQYSFSGLGDGFYYLSAKVPQGYVLTYDGDSRTDGNTIVRVSNGKVTAIGNIPCSDCHFSGNIGIRLGGNLKLEGRVCLDDPSGDGKCDNLITDYGLDQIFLQLLDENGSSLGRIETDQDGAYSIPNLPSGSYEIFMEQKGFPLNISSLSTTLEQSPAYELIDSTFLIKQKVALSNSLSNLDFAFLNSRKINYGTLPPTFMAELEEAYHVEDSTINLSVGSTVVYDGDPVAPSQEGQTQSTSSTGVVFQNPQAWTGGSFIDGNGGSVEIEINGEGWLTGWIDFNGDQDFSDEGEMILNQAVSTSTQIYGFDIPEAGVQNSTIQSRLRLFTETPTLPEIAFFGGTIGGEVADQEINATTFPVELSEFEAIANSDHVLLKWTSAKEINTSSFMVERSLDGKLFNKIGQVPAAGQSDVPINYRFRDEKAFNIDQPQLYYRLKNVDLDGAFTYSAIESIKPSFDTEISFIIHPNPTTSQLNIRLYAPKEENMKLEVISTLGQILLTQQIKAHAGINHLTYNISSFLPGIYYAKIYTPLFSQVFKFKKK